MSDFESIFDRPAKLFQFNLSESVNSPCLSQPVCGRNCLIISYAEFPNCYFKGSWRKTRPYLTEKPSCGLRCRCHKTKCCAGRSLLGCHELCQNCELWNTGSLWSENHQLQKAKNKRGSHFLINKYIILAPRHSEDWFLTLPFIYFTVIWVVPLLRNWISVKAISEAIICVVAKHSQVILFGNHSKLLYCLQNRVDTKCIFFQFAKSYSIPSWFWYC